MVRFQVCENRKIDYYNSLIKACKDFWGDSILEFDVETEIAFLQQHFSKNFTRFPHKADAFSDNQYFVLFSAWVIGLIFQNIDS